MNDSYCPSCVESSSNWNWKNISGFLKYYFKRVLKFNVNRNCFLMKVIQPFIIFRLRKLRRLNAIFNRNWHLLPHLLPYSQSTSYPIHHRRHHCLHQCCIFRSCSIDYCNSFYYALPDTQLKSLHQNAPAGVVTVSITHHLHIQISSLV